MNKLSLSSMMKNYSEHSNVDFPNSENLVNPESIQHWKYMYIYVYIYAFFFFFSPQSVYKTSCLLGLQEVLANDFFLVALQDEFRENARLFIFETYCRIHERIDMRGLAERLNMSFDHAERWIVDLIRNAR